MKKRILSLLTALITLASLTLSFGSLAGAQSFTGDCGAAGSELSWELDAESGELVISGNGVMTGYSESDAPWLEYSELITCLKVEQGVTKLGEGAFKDLKQLCEVSLPTGLERIGKDAFRNSGITQITVPDNVTVIEEGAFYRCSALEEVQLPSGLKEIKAEAFYECSLLDGVEIPSGAEKIGNSAFYRCIKLTSVKFPLTLRTVGENAFDSCTRLMKVFYEGSSAQWERNVTVADGNSKLSTAVMICDNAVISGDATGDGRITISDVLAVRKLIAGIETPEGFVEAACDVTGEGRVTLSDVLNIRKYVAGMIDTLPIQK